VTPERETRKEGDANGDPAEWFAAVGERPDEYFTGAVRVDPLFQAAAPARVTGANVTFEPGARTAWHTHPLGQTLVVTAGCGKNVDWMEKVTDEQYAAGANAK
jgi:hypothetical protein